MEIIELCDNWYSGKSVDKFHKRKNLNNKEIEISRINFAKRCCADDANLCEIISVAPEKESKSQEFIDRLLADNRFDVRYREQLEKTSATGTVGAYIYLHNAEYVQDKDGVVTATVICRGTYFKGVVFDGEIQHPGRRSKKVYSVHRRAG